ncbi:hypothetical protein SNOG_16275 [Parastagonospora nodorum SN15]|uniref:Uncharacterized protein n=1 Tax=Phaeosphaeria nodorum (strain SN15 / ATCC MYA-4574 / FGSC 10173) TaxID=321614 RepID=Q0TVW3_PHANO|nr:hypothetical protein SNOG_16275 [Parastagonospora nodorum SN15]EAT76261.1 hypothetical protein SNOG_16275 [Parastagonospora nodorum SN15]
MASGVSAGFVLCEGSVLLEATMSWEVGICTGMPRITNVPKQNSELNRGAKLREAERGFITMGKTTLCQSEILATHTD